MTISTTTARVAYTGDGATVNFAVPFAFFGTTSTAELEVIERTIATGAEVTKTNVTDYTVSGGSGSTGTVTANSAPASTVQWIIRRNTTRTQATDYTTNDAFPADTHETALDRALAISQEIEETVGRALVFPKSDSSTLSAEIPSSVDRASARLGFDADGNPVAVTADVTGVAATATGSSLAQAASAAAANAVIFAKGTDVASATTMTIPTDGSYFDVTGTTTITGMTVDADRVFMLQFDGALTLTDGASLKLGSANITTAAGDRAIFFATAADTVEMLAYHEEAAPAKHIGQGKHTLFVPAAAMTPTVSNGCASLTKAETTAGRPDMVVLDFDASADEHAQFQIAFPDSWDEGTVTAQFFWTSTATDTDGVTWAIQGVACSDGDTIDVAYGTAVTVDDANQSTAEDLYVSAESGAITIAGTPAAGDMCFFRVFRDVSDANDTATEDARLIGVKLFYTVAAGNDA